MFWHEAKENDINLYTYNKSDYLKMTNPKSNKKDSKDSLDDSIKGLNNNILDLTENFKTDMLIPSDWGPGKVVSTDKATKKVVLKIEGNNQEFDMFLLKTYLNIYIYVIFKDANLRDRKVTLSLNIYLDETIGRLKRKLANIFHADEKKVFIVYRGLKLTDDEQKFSEFSLYPHDVFLAVINGTCVY